MKKIFCTLSLLFILGLSNLQAQGLDSLIINGLKSYERGNLKEAFDYYDAALKKYPQLPYLYILKAEAIFNSGFAGKQRLPQTDPVVYDSAIVLLDKALALAPNSPEVHGARGLLHTIHQKYDLAVEDFSKVLSNVLDFDKIFNALSDRASAYLRLRQFDKALSDYERALELKPNEKGVKVNISELYVMKGDTTKAEEILLTVLEEDSTYSQALNNLGVLKIDQQQYEEANDIFQKLLTIDNRDAVTLNNYGFSLAMSGQYEMGISLINQSLKLYKSNAYAYRNLGIIALNKGETETACAHFNKAKILDFETSYGDEIDKLMAKHCE